MIMNKVSAIIILVCLIPAVLFAQDREIKKLFSKYEDVSGFTMDTEDPDINVEIDGNFGEFLNSVDNIYVLKFDKEKGKLSDRDAFEKKLLSLCDKKKFTTMLDISGEGSVKMMSRKNSKDKPTDFLMITSGEEESMYFWAAAD
jgi:hypothetical protein